MIDVLLSHCPTSQWRTPCIYTFVQLEGVQFVLCLNIQQLLIADQLNKVRLKSIMEKDSPSASQKYKHDHILLYELYFTFACVMMHKQTSWMSFAFQQLLYISSNYVIAATATLFFFSDSLVCWSNLNVADTVWLSNLHTFELSPHIKEREALFTQSRAVREIKKFHKDREHQSAACFLRQLPEASFIPIFSFQNKRASIVGAHKQDCPTSVHVLCLFICNVDSHTHSLVSQHINTGREHRFVHPLSSADMTGNLYPTSEEGQKK